MQPILKSGTLEVLCLGKIVQDPRYCKKIGTNLSVYPVGFRSIRSGPAKDGKGTTTFTSLILEGDNGPLFTVSAADEPDVVHAADNPSAAWIAALTPRTSGEKITVQGPLKYGLTVDAVIEEIKKLEGYDELVGAQQSEKKAAKVPPKAAAAKTSTVPAEGAVAPSKRAPKNASAAAEGPTKPAAAAQSEPSASRTSTKRARGATEVPKCDVCGLTSPFCAQSGKIHIFAITPCHVCKKITTYCCETGQLHAPLHQPAAADTSTSAVVKGPRNNAADTIAAADPDGVAPKKTRKPRADSAAGSAAVGPDGEAVPKKAKKPRVDPAADSAAVGPDGEAVPKKAKKPRVDPAASASGADGSAPQASDPTVPKGKQRQRTLDEVPKKPVDVVDVPPPPPKPFVYPPLRSVVPRSEHNAYAKQLATPDEAAKKRMDADGVVSAAAVKRYVQFVAMYASEKSVQDAAKASKGQPTKDGAAPKDQKNDVHLVEGAAVMNAPDSNAIEEQATDGTRAVAPKSKSRGMSKAEPEQATTVE